MSKKVVKLNQKDIQNIVENILKEQDDWRGSEDPEIRDLASMSPEEQPGFEDYEGQDDVDNADLSPDDSDNEKVAGGDPDGIPLKLAKDPNGNFFIFKDDGTMDSTAYMGKVTKQ